MDPKYIILERKLTEYGQVGGMVFGAFGEASDAVHDLMQKIAVSRVNAMGLQQGRDSYKGELGVTVGQVRKILSVGAVRA